MLKQTQKMKKTGRWKRIGLFLVVYLALLGGIYGVIKVAFPSFSADNIKIPISGTTGVGICPDGQTADKCATTKYNWGSYIGTLYVFLIKLGAMLAVVMLIYAAYTYLTSQGDTSKINQAKDIMLGAILGFVLLMVVALIVKYLGLPASDISVK